MILNLGAMLFAAQGLTTVSSRLLLSFARDRGLGPLSPYLTRIHPKLKVPLYAIACVSSSITAIGAINLGSPIALNAVLSATVVLLQISYFVPIALVLVRGVRAFHGALGEEREETSGEVDRRWSLGRWRRPVNAAAAVFLLVTTVTFLFPPAIPVRGGAAMNWVVVVCAVVWVLCGVTWLVDGRKRFSGPSALAERLAMGRAA